MLRYSHAGCHILYALLPPSTSNWPTKGSQPVRQRVNDAGGFHKKESRALRFQLQEAAASCFVP